MFLNKKYKRDEKGFYKVLLSLETKGESIDCYDYSETYSDELEDYVTISLDTLDSDKSRNDVKNKVVELVNKYAPDNFRIVDTEKLSYSDGYVCFTVTSIENRLPTRAEWELFGDGELVFHQDTISIRISIDDEPLGEDEIYLIMEGSLKPVAIPVSEELKSVIRYMKIKLDFSDEDIVTVLIGEGIPVPDSSEKVYDKTTILKECGCSTPFARKQRKLYKYNDFGLVIEDEDMWLDHYSVVRPSIINKRNNH